VPIYELLCKNPACDQFDRKRETFFKSYTDIMPPCPECGHATVRVPSVAHAIWLGTLDRYNAPGCQTLNGVEDGGHIAYRTRSSRMVDGSPEPVVIRTRQDQRAYCKAEGLMMPDEMPQHCDWEDKSASSQGLPGSWASVNPDFIKSEAAKPLPPEAAAPASVTERSVEVRSE
jgi:hypothetical protein